MQISSFHVAAAQLRLDKRVVADENVCDLKSTVESI